MEIDFLTTAAIIEERRLNVDLVMIHSSTASNTQWIVVEKEEPTGYPQVLLSALPHLLPSLVPTSRTTKPTGIRWTRSRNTSQSHLRTVQWFHVPQAANKLRSIS
jgi:hypothetical protein